MTTWPTTYCDKAVSPNCPGHQGWEKWPDCLIPAIVDSPDECTGSVDGFGMWVGLIIQEKEETVPSCVDVPVTIPAGTYVVIRENDQGHVAVEQFDTAQAAQDAFDGWESAYGDYRAGQDAYEESIMSSTGLSFAAIDGVC